MMQNFQLCRLPVVALGLIAMVLNTIMVVVVFKRKSFNRPINIVFAYVGLIDLAISISLMGRGATKNIFSYENELKLLEPFLVSFLISLSMLQLLANVEMAYNRYNAVVLPLEFRTANRSKTVRRIIFECLFSFIIGFGTGFPSAFYRFPRLTSITIAVSRLVALIVVSILYCKIISKLRLNSRVAAVNREKNGVRQNVTSQETGRDRANKRLLKICLAIPVYNFILNLPLIIYNCMFDFGEPCQSVNGKVLVFLMSLLLIDLVLDPILYFKATRRPRVSAISGLN